MEYKAMVMYAVLLAVVGSATGAAYADCDLWSKQDSGKYQRVCTDDNGNMYCEEADDNKGTNKHKVTC
jgi:hypothetical protein